mmetsp:Transcript_54461/g.119203  ORF Transcript_54461/g.119203 Transcript_54461/m.119203 type:complete len:221 (+) Transcript_54461:2366-3028(+)
MCLHDHAYQVHVRRVLLHCQGPHDVTHILAFRVRSVHIRHQKGCRAGLESYSVEIFGLQRCALNHPHLLQDSQVLCATDTQALGQLLHDIPLALHVKDHHINVLGAVLIVLVKELMQKVDQYLQRWCARNEDMPETISVGVSRSGEPSCLIVLQHLHKNAHKQVHTGTGANQRNDLRHRVPWVQVPKAYFAAGDEHHVQGSEERPPFVGSCILTWWFAAI